MKRNERKKRGRWCLKKNNNKNKKYYSIKIGSISLIVSTPLDVFFFHFIILIILLVFMPYADLCLHRGQGSFFISLYILCDFFLWILCDYVYIAKDLQFFIWFVQRVTPWISSKLFWFIRMYISFLATMSLYEYW